MAKALKSALDFVINDIHPEGDNVPNFMDLIPEFQSEVGAILQERLMKLDYMNENLVGELLGEVGYQMANPEGPNFEALVGLPALVAAFLEPAQVGELMGVVRDGIVDGTSQAVSRLALEEKYQRAAMNALRDGMRLITMAFE